MKTANQIKRRDLSAQRRRVAWSETYVFALASRNNRPGEQRRHRVERQRETAMERGEDNRSDMQAGGLGGPSVRPLSPSQSSGGHPGGGGEEIDGLSPFSSANCLASSYVTSRCASKSALFPMRIITCGGAQRIQNPHFPHTPLLSNTQRQTHTRTQGKTSVPGPL